MYSRKIDDKVYSFGHEGELYRQSFIMYDRETDSRWVHTTGEAVKGPSKGKVLSFLPSSIATWKKWKQLHPDTTVLTGKRARGRMGHFGLKQKPEQYGLSIGQGPKPKLYPFSILMKQRAVNDEHEGRPVLVVYDAESGTARAYDRGGHTFTWKEGALRDEQGRSWNLLRGTLEGEPRERLRQIPATTWLVARWRGFHPRSPRYK